MVEAIRVESSANGISVDEEQIGVLKVSLKRGRELPPDIKVLLGLSDSDTYLEMHLDDPVKRDNPYDIPRVFRQDFSLTAHTAEIRDWRFSYLIGISHEALIHSTKLYGFKLLPVNPDYLTEEQLERIRKGYKKTKSYLKGKPMGPIIACYLSYDDLMSRYNGHREVQSDILR